MTKELKIYQICKNQTCNSKYAIDEMLFGCKKCGFLLEYVLEGNYTSRIEQRQDLWKNFDFLPLQLKENIISLGVGDSEIIHLEELSKEVNGANIFLMCDISKNPTGTFKDREASIIMSRCKELGLDNLVFYSTANTGRSYTHYAAHLGLTTYMFMPRQCAYKNTKFIRKNPNNFIIFVDNDYPAIGPYTKLFAKKNNLTPIAPMHDRTECYATIAYEQFQKLPNCAYFVQTIASGMGPIGFYKGHKNLVKLGLQKEKNIPKTICVQSSEMNVMAKAFNSGRKTLDNEDLPTYFPEDLFEPTLNSTNPVNNYPEFRSMLMENEGIILDVSPTTTMKEGFTIVKSLERRGIHLRHDLEKSLLIEYAGVVQLAKRHFFKKHENILLLACGRGRDSTDDLIEPDAVINVKSQDPIHLLDSLHELNKVS